MDIQNELENKLAKLIAEGIAEDEFIPFLLNAQIFMPIQGNPGASKDFDDNAKPQPLIVKDEDDTEVLVVFSSTERAREFMQDYPDYVGGLLTEFSWVLRKLDGPLNISLNPGWEYGINLDEELIDVLRSSLPPES